MDAVFYSSICKYLNQQISDKKQRKINQSGRTVHYTNAYEVGKQMPVLYGIWQTTADWRTNQIVRLTDEHLSINVSADILNDRSLRVAIITQLFRQITVRDHLGEQIKKSQIRFCLSRDSRVMDHENWKNCLVLPFLLFHFRKYDTTWK